LARAAVMRRRATLAEARREFDERFIRAALARSGGHASAAARELGVSRQGLRKLTMRLGLKSTDEEGPAAALE
jgi:DNA-binding NtrC family response regulator